MKPACIQPGSQIWQSSSSISKGLTNSEMAKKVQLLDQTEISEKRLEIRMVDGHVVTRMQCVLNRETDKSQ